MQQREIVRLEKELATAQHAYDTATTDARAVTHLRRADVANGAYIAELEDAIRRLARRWTAGHAARTITLAKTRADAAATATVSDEPLS